MRKITIIVLGDIGRSPRMQYHALSFADEGFAVNLVGYGGSVPLARIQAHPNINVHLMSPFPLTNQIPKLLEYALKTIWQIITLFCTLIFRQSGDYVLVQNPPAVPVLFVCWLYCVLSATKFIIDWHNYAYTIMALPLSSRHPLVRLTKWQESFFGKRAHASFCVTKAMKKDLEQNWGVKNVHVLYDRAPEMFKQISVQEKIDLFKRLSQERVEFNLLLNERSKTALVVSSTSWTEDEDFSILLEALTAYDLNESGDFPKLLCVITGKGPLKAFYEAKIAKINWKRVTIVTIWLQSDDYPTLLASADLGVCLHKSSSGLDLPMKVVDMFGCQLPVFAFDYNCLNELVKDGVNGFVFQNKQQLANLLKMWFNGYPNLRKVNDLISELATFQALRWHENWCNNVLPIVNEL